MSRTMLAGMLGLGLAACVAAAAGEPALSNPDRRPLGSPAVNRTLVVGTLIEATIHSPLPWGRNQPGETLTATVSADVRNAHRWVVIPAGSRVGLRIAPRGPANQGQAYPRMVLDVTSLTVWGQIYPVSATVDVTPVAGGGASREVVGRAPRRRILFVLREGLTVERPREETRDGDVTLSPASK